MFSWFTRLFAPKGLLGQRMHAWHYGPYGRAHVEGEVVEETDWEVTLDPSAPERQEYRAFVRVWKHDARPLGEALPIDLSYVGEGT